MMANPDFKWKKQPEIRVWRKKSDNDDDTSVELESFGLIESVDLFNDALKNNEVSNQRTQFLFLVCIGLRYYLVTGYIIKHLIMYCS